MNNLSISDMEIILKKLNNCQIKLKKHIKDMEHLTWVSNRNDRILEQCKRQEQPLPIIKVLCTNPYNSKWNVLGTNITFYCYNHDKSCVQSYLIDLLQSRFLLNPCRTQKTVYVSNKNN